MFIVIDGLDGSGKSTQAEKLCDHIESLGMTYVIRSHPSGDNYLGRKGREYLLRQGSWARILASAFYMLDVIRSVLYYRWSKVDFVVFVRYLMGTGYLPSPLHRIAYMVFKMVRGRVLELAQRREWTIIDGDQSLEAIQSEIRGHLGL